jgi:hypothetical protein
LKIKTITTWNNKLYEEYAHRFKETYNWPFPLKIYNEDECMMKAIPNLKEFVERNKDRQPYSDYKVKGKEFLTDGVRFSYKVYAYTHALMTENVDGLICIDADSVFYKKIDEEWVKKHIHRDECMMTYLGRGSNYSECGFLYFNLNHADTLAYANRMKSLYDTDGIYNLKEQHDSYVWDYVRKEFENRGTRNHNIGDGKPGHVQARSILGVVYDHTKGNRKLKGRSGEARA